MGTPGEVGQLAGGRWARYGALLVRDLRVIPGHPLHCATNCPGSEMRTYATPNHHSKLIYDPPIGLSSNVSVACVRFYDFTSFGSGKDTGRVRSIRVFIWLGLWIHTMCSAGHCC